MPEQRPKFTREPADQRKQALILATLDVIARAGVRAATVREIAARAGVTPGLIRHHFAGKDALIAAAYAHHMARMTGAVADRAGVTAGSLRARRRLEGFVRASLAPGVMRGEWVALWAGFLNEALHDAALRAIHARTYRQFRDMLEDHIGAALAEAGMADDEATRRRLAIACNAVIDGLWMEGGALPDSFGPDELARIGLGAVAAITGLDLEQKAEEQ